MHAIFTRLRSFALGTALSTALLPAIWSAPLAAANLSGASMADYSAFPVTSIENVTPKVMLAMSRDHQYYFKAYNDFTDLDGDGEVDTTYQHNFKYYGYFDPDKCYSYKEQNLSGAGFVQQFYPRAFTSDRYCDTVDGEWSGNFLNWATMTRMDIVRKIIYGGRRYEDKASHTLLERALLPTDGHSFAKYYNGADLAKLTPFSGIKTDSNGGDNDLVDDKDEGITICNTTMATSGKSETTTARPLMRIVKGNHSLWAASEVFQCNFRGELSDSDHGKNGNDPGQSGIEAEADSPSRSTAGLTYDGFGPDWQLHILACVPGLIASADNDNENCRRYPNGNYKPAGLLQEYGEEELIHFGLFTGTFQRNITGGVLRKNIGPLDDEINMDTDGTFKADPNSAVPSVGVIRALDIFKIWGYGYGQRRQSLRYDGSASSDTCGFQLASITEGKCASWGNPMGEIYAEAVRYFAGLSPTAGFAANDNNYVGGLAEDEWADPLNDDNWCAGLDMVVINSSLLSYDEGTGHFMDIGAPDPVALTNDVGDAEGITGNDYLVGRTSAKTSPANATNDEFCTSKTVNGLGEVVGICPEGPTIDGTFQIAGMAHYANTQDIRPELQGNQTVTTYAVQLATNVPRIEIDLDQAADTDEDGDAGNDADVTILPAYRLTGKDGGGTLVDFKIVEKYQEIDGKPGVFHGKVMVVWDDSEQGGDFDNDVWGVIDYEVDTTVSPQTVTVTTNVINAATSNPQLFGFSISGTTQDGFHAYSGIFDATYNDADSTMPSCSNNIGVAGGDNNCDASDAARSHTFTAGTTGAELLPDPLFLAAKYGGFIDSDGDDLPDVRQEYDIRDEFGTKVPGGDGIPDTYFFVSNPAALEDSLRAVFDQIIERVASGTAAAVVASSQEGVGAVFQALYDPFKSDFLGNETRWMGTLHALFVDPQGFLREDGDGDQKLDGYDVDKVVEVFFDEDLKRSRVRRYTSSSATTFEASGSVEDELEQLKPIWNARQRLSALSDVTTQRDYATPADSGRHILTWIDDDLDGLVATDGSEQVAFDTDTFGDDNFGWIDVWDGVTLDASEAHKLIDYIRGEEQDGYRSRVVDYNKDGTTEIMRLGDIVNSTPTVQGAPAEAFDLLALDSSYADFRALYRNRRNVVYVGANDGMVHAFNVGFFDVQNNAFVTSLDGEVAHPLGAELWAYVPKNLLGHLQWLADPEYSHVYYADLKPRLFDAKIFPADAAHPHGWGTVLVVGMRLGGGHDNNGIVLDTAADGIGVADADGDTSDDVATKSAYVVLDVTDPEVPPRVIAELSPPGQFFTTASPAPVVIGEAEPSGNVAPPNKWYLVLGSGPTDLGAVESNQSARLFAYDLGELVAGNDGVVESGPFSNGVANDGIGFVDTGEVNTFVGEFTIADQDVDMKSEALYFGTVGTTASDSGSFYRMNLHESASPTGWEAPFKLLAANKPFSTRASITIDQQFRTWLVAGTGRLYSNADKATKSTQTLYGFIDQYSIPNNPLVNPASPTPLDHAAFIDVTNAETYSNGDVDLDGDGDADTTFKAFADTVADAGGWSFNFEFDPSAVDPSEREVVNPVLIGGISLASLHTPALDQCGAEGRSRIIGRAFNSGLVPPLGVFGSEACASCPDGVTRAVGSVDLGAGLASSPSIHIGSQDVPGKVTVIVQQSTGAITGKEAQTLGGLKNGEISWQEFRAE